MCSLSFGLKKQPLLKESGVLKWLTETEIVDEGIKGRE